MAEPSSCPRCGATGDIRYRNKRGDWFCDACDYSWSGEPPGGARAQQQDIVLRPVFVSYGHADAPEFARRLRDDLTAAGCHVWLDIDAIEEGAHWDVRIESGIRDADVLLAIMTPHSTHEESICRDEVILAHAEGKAIVPVRVSEDAAVRPALLLVRRSWLDFTKDYEAALATLLRFLSGDECALKQPAFTLVNGHVPFDPGPEIARHAAGFVGRDWLFAALDAWLANPKGRAFVIVGGPGSGKSAIAARLSQRSGDAAAVHFCWSGNARSLDPSEFVASVVGALSERVPRYAEALAERSPDSPREDASAAFRELVVEPALKTPAPARPQLLIVDALDEAVTRAGLTIADVLLTHAESLPAWLRIVATTRPEARVLDRLRRLDTLELDAEGAGNRADVASFVAQRLSEPALTERLGDDSVAAAARLAELAAGNFLYATMALDALEAGTLTTADLDELSPGLSDYYTKAFLRAFPNPERYADEEAPIVRCLTAAFAPLPLRVLQAATGLDPETFNRRLRRLRPFLHEGAADGVPTISLFHRSTADWLTNAREAGDFFCDLAAGHAMLAAALGSDPTRDDYALRWLPRHLTALERWDDLFATLTDFTFLEEKARRVAVAKTTSPDGDVRSVYNGVRALVEDCDHALAAMPSGQTEAAGRGDALGTPRRYVLAALRRALRLEAHNLSGHSVARHRAFFWQQLYNRLQWDARAESGGDDSTGVSLLAGLLAPELSRRSAADAPPWLNTLSAPTESEALLLTLAGHAGAVFDCVCAPDGETVASAHSDGVVKLWNTRDGTERLTLAPQAGRLRACAFSPDGRTVASAGDDATLQLWDARSGALLTTLRGHESRIHSCAFSPDGRTLASGSDDATVRVWDVATGACRATLNGHSGAVYACAFSPDGATIASGGDDRTVRLWEAVSGACLMTLTGHRDTVFACPFAPDGRTIATASGDKTLKLWDATTGNERRTLVGHTGRVRACAFAPDGTTVASAGGFHDATLRLWDARSGDALVTLSGHTDRVYTCAFAPDGRTIVSGGGDTTLRLWNVRAAGVRPGAGGHSERVYACAFAPDGQTIVTASGDHTLRLWDAFSTEEGAILRDHDGPVYACAFAPDGRSIVSASDDETLRVWDAAQGTALAKLTGHRGPVYACAWAPSGRMIASGGGDATLRLWDAGSFEERLVLNGHTDRVRACAFAPDGATIASAADDGTLRLWDPTTGAERRTLCGHSGRVVACAYAPDGQTIVSAGVDRTLRLWDAANGAPLVVLEGHAGRVRACAFAAGGHLVVSGSGDKSLRIWDAATGAEIMILCAPGGLLSCAASPRGGRLCCGDAGGNFTVLALKGSLSP